MPDTPEYLLSTLALTDEQRTALEHELVPLARLAALGGLAGDIGHDLANELFAVLGHVDLLLADADPGAAATDRLGIVRNTALDMRTGLRALLDYARPPEHAESASLDDATRGATILVRQGNARQLAIAATYPDQPVIVRCAPAELTQAVLHVVAAGRAAAGDAGSIDVDVTDDGALHVEPAVTGTLGIVAARRIAIDHGGTLEQSGAGLLLRLPVWVAS
jgi:signal transduction histidine kinase